MNTHRYLLLFSPLNSTPLVKLVVYNLRICSCYFLSPKCYFWTPTSFFSP